MTDNVCKSNGGDTSNEQIRGANDVEDFTIVTNTWTSRRIEEITDKLYENVADCARRYRDLTDEQLKSARGCVSQGIKAVVTNGQELTFAQGDSIKETVRAGLARYARNNRLTEAIGAMSKIVDESVDAFVRVSRMDWTVERMEAIKRSAARSVEDFTSAPPTKLTESRINRIKTLVDESVAREARKGCVLTTALVERIKEIFAESIELYCVQNSLASAGDWTNDLRTLAGNCVDVATTSKGGRLQYLKDERVQRIGMFVYRDLMLFTRERRTGWADGQVKKMAAFAYKKVERYMNDEYKTWTPELIERIRTFVRDGVERCAGDDGAWVPELLAETTDEGVRAFLGKIASEIVERRIGEQTPPAPELVDKIKKVATESLKRYYDEHSLALTPELKEKFCLYLTRFAGVPENNKELLYPLWNSYKDYEGDDKEALLGKYTAALARHFKTARTEETPPKTREFLQQKGWNRDGRELELEQVIDCVYCGAGFTGDNGKLGGNPFYDLALFQRLKNAGAADNAYTAYRETCEEKLLAMIYSNRAGVLADLDAEEFYQEFQFNVFVDNYPYKGDAGLSAYLQKACARNLAKLKEQIMERGVLRNFDADLANVPQDDDDNQGSEPNNDAGLFETVKRNIDDALLNLKTVEVGGLEYNANARRLAYALRLGAAWAKEIELIGEEARLYMVTASAEKKRKRRKDKVSGAEKDGAASEEKDCERCKDEVPGTEKDGAESANNGRKRYVFGKPVAGSNEKQITGPELKYLCRQTKWLGSKVRRWLGAAYLKEQENDKKDQSQDKEIDKVFGAVQDEILTAIAKAYAPQAQRAGDKKLEERIRNAFEKWLSFQWRARLGELWCNGNKDVSEGVSNTVAAWIECVDRIDRETGEYRSFFNENQA